MGGWWDWGERKAGRPTKDESPKKEERRPRADDAAEEDDSAERASIESVGSERSSSAIRREVEVLVLLALLL